MGTRLSASDTELAIAFTALIDFAGIARLLEITSTTLAYYLRNAGNYKQFELAKRTGGKRIISVPVTPLKIIQKKLNQVLQAVYRGRSPAHGFSRGKSIVTNASKHLSRDFVLNFDLQDFFPTIHFGRVLGLFEGKPYGLSTPVAVTLAQICCHMGALPAGAPTSPTVSNMICAKMDSQLKRLAVDSDCTYTRYADDITISKAHGRLPPHIAQHDLNTLTWRVGDAVEVIIKANGFQVHPQKTRVLPRGYRQEVTGLIVNGRLNVKRTFIQEARSILHSCERWGVPMAEAEFLAKFDRKQRLNKKVSLLKVLRGKIEFVGSVRGRDDIIYVQLLERYLRLDPKAHTRRVLIGPNASGPVLERAVWILEDSEVQGSGFAADNLGLLTAAHVLTPTTQATCPALSIVAGVPVDHLYRDNHVDVARCQPRVSVPIQFRLCLPPNLKMGDRVRVLGFPLHRSGNSVNIQDGRITSFSTWFGVRHVVVDCSIVVGNSGGPVLNARNEVIGIAVKGQRIPKQFGKDDEMSRFVPIDVAMQHLQPKP